MGVYLQSDLRAEPNGARNMLLAFQQDDSDRGHFAQQKNFAETEAWYKKLGATAK